MLRRFCVSILERVHRGIECRMILLDAAPDFFDELGHDSRIIPMRGTL
jgi:hypothetical protein